MSCGLQEEEGERRQGSKRGYEEEEEAESEDEGGQGNRQEE